MTSTGVAQADDTALEPLDPVRVVSPLTLVQGDGIKIGEGTALYPQVGLETGFISNTFYSATDPIASGIARLLVEIGTGSLSDQRRKIEANGGTTSPGSFQYEADAYAAYDQYLSGNGNVTGQSGLGLGIHLKGLVNPEQPISFLAQEGFDRILRAVNYESRTNANRDLNTVMLRLGINPTGRSLGGTITYTNRIDLFEDSTESFADRMLNTLGLRLNWRFLPLSVAYLEFDQGFYTGLGSSSTKVDSFPLSAFAGISTALTLKTAIIAQAGYTQGFYSSGPDYQSPTAGVYLEHHYSPLGAIRLKYAYEHSDSINANFFRDHLFQAWFEQKFVPFAVYVTPEVRLRQYQGLNGPLMGPLVRDDLILAAAVGLRYQYRNWLTASAEYRVIDDQTNYRYTGGASPIDPSYVRHEVFAGIRVAY